MKTTLIILTLLLPLSLFAGQAEELFAAGNRDYLDGKWEDALHKYAQIESEKQQSGTLFYNMGNCYYKLNQLGRAIYYWERAHKLMGDDPELVTNLKIARAKITDKVDEQVELPVWGWLDRTRANFRIGTNGWLVVTVSAVLFIVLALRRWLFRGVVVRKALYWVAIVLVLRLAVDLAFVGIDAHNASRNHWGVIFGREVEVLSAPAEGSGKLLFSLHEGAKVRVLRELDQWAEISAGKDKQGWAKLDQMGLY